MAIFPIPHDEHVYERQHSSNRDLNDIEPLTVKRALEWLDFPTWKRHEAILLLAGHDPTSRRYYDEDGAAGSLARDLFHALPQKEKLPFSEYFAWMKDHRLVLPHALLTALASDATSQASTEVESTEALSASSVALPDSLRPLTTLDIAFAFAGLRKWNEAQWKKSLGNKPKWLVACVAISGKQGVCQTKWNPVSIGAALINSGHTNANSVRARFQTKPPLKPWLETWKTYEADHLDTE